MVILKNLYFLKLSLIEIDHQVVGKSRKRVNTTGMTYLLNIFSLKLIIHFCLCSSQIADTYAVDDHLFSTMIDHEYLTSCASRID